MTFSLVALPAAAADPAASAPVFTGVDGGDLGAQWTATADGPQPFDAVSPDLAIPLTMDDGVVIKTDVLHPAHGADRSNEPGPVIVQFQGYGKQLVNIASVLIKIPGIKEALLPWIASVQFPGSGLDGITDLTSELSGGALEQATQDLTLVKGGYTLVQVDIRGTGTSEGTWQAWGDRERRDAMRVLDWIDAQPWSNGKVGIQGTSWTGITAMQAAATAGDRVKAVFAVVPSSDILTDIIAPGGGVGIGFAPLWLTAISLARMLPDAEAVLAGRFDPAQQLQWVRDRIANPAPLLDVIANVVTATTTDQFTAKTKEFMDANSPLRQALTYDSAAVTAPTFRAGAFSDIFANSPTDSYNRSRLSAQENKLVMGDGYHINPVVEGYGRPGTPPRVDVLQRAWFDKWLKGIDNGAETYSPLSFQHADGSWSTTSSFPRPGVDYQRMYLGPATSGSAPTAQYDGSLTRTADPGIQDLTVAPSLLSICSRDGAVGTAGALSVIVACAEDSRIREREGLTFSSGPVAESTAVSGPIAVHLNTIHDTQDGYWTVTVNDVAPDGWSRQLSSGQLVSSLRQIDDSRSTTSANGDYTRPIPYVDINRRQKVVPGQPVTLDIATTPIDATLEPGHRLRIDVFASNFPRGLPPTAILVDSQLAPQHLRLDPSEPSWVNIPLSLSIPE
ncbi:CocE/NonD family hydrolase [Nocardia sp. NPDC058058]|uniref:CocE/NonD family hydrolase n=1 Tax=Nocardia sp. NPDC058058 TaxID=3346317 RepID=UPI0036DD158F